MAKQVFDLRVPLLIFLDLLVDRVLLDLGHELAVAQALQATTDYLWLRIVQTILRLSSGLGGLALVHCYITGHSDLFIRFLSKFYFS